MDSSFTPRATRTLAAGVVQCVIMPWIATVSLLIPMLVDFADDEDYQMFWRRDRTIQRERWMDRFLHLSPEHLYDALRVDRNVFSYPCRAWAHHLIGTGKKACNVMLHVAMVLVRFGSGMTYRELGLLFGYSHTRVHQVVQAWIEFNSDYLMEEWIRWPNEDDMAMSEDDFQFDSGIPGIVGAMDGTLLASWPGSVNDAKVFNNSKAKRRIEAGGIGNRVIVSDAAYGLKDYTYVPYRATPGQLLPDAQAVWNKQQSRARKIVEQVNGRLKTKWRILDGRMECHRRHVPATIAAVVTLHNIELILGTRYRMETPYPRNWWWLRGPTADLVHTGRGIEGFTAVHRRNRFCAYLYASWRLGHPEITRPLLGYVRRVVSWLLELTSSVPLSSLCKLPAPIRARHCGAP
ncbi:unnamed protein product [Closterium sp. Yama58-4]|nr:unnamed protein product [Closterium sp. Yama58-4]